MTQELEKDLEVVSTELETGLLRAERELELEHSQLKALVGKENPDLAAKVEAMEDSITRLYEGLEKARMYLQLAQGESYLLRKELQESATFIPA
ncbi:MAG: hypothetical protein AAGC74_05715 [Verrucomicrobiota bacterium]